MRVRSAILGLGGFFLNDIIIARSFTAVDIAYWAETKSWVLIVGVVLSCGLDQVIVRRPHYTRYLVGLASGSLVFFICLTTIVLFVVGVSGDRFYLFAAIVLMALATLLHGIFRAHHQFLKAQLVKNGWRAALPICTLIAVWFVPGGAAVLYSFLGTLTLAILGIIVFNWQVLRKILVTHAAHPPRPSVEIKLGLKLVVSLLTLALSLHLEQLLLNQSNFIAASAQYFSHAALVWPPLIIISGYSGFLLGPYIQKDSTAVVRWYRAWFVRVAIALAILLAVVYVVVKALFEYLITPEILFSTPLTLLLLAIGAARAMYVFPSAFVGGLANPRQLNVFVGSNVVGVLVLVVSFYLFLSWGVAPVFAVGLASLCNWLIRIVVGYRLLINICHTVELG